jgi:hypothetical protein
MKVYVVCFSDYDEHWIVATYASEEKAEARAKVENQKRGKESGRDYGYEVEDCEVIE